MHIKSFAAGFIVAGIVGGIAWHYQPAPQQPTQIAFPDKSLTDMGDALLFMGTISGQGIGYPNNTLFANCSKSEMTCNVATVQQIGANQVGPIDIDSYPITAWTDGLVTAKEDTVGTSACTSTTINILRQSGEIQWIQEPVNQSAPNCIHVDTTTYKWTVEPSPFWADFYKRFPKKN
jgi:hypothetical protein